MPLDDDKEDNRNEFEKAIDSLTGKAKDLFGKITGQEGTESKPDPDVEARKKQSPEHKAAVNAFFLAVRHNNRAEVKKFIDKGFDLNGWNIAGETALHLAARQGHVELAEMLLKSGANPKTGKRSDKVSLPLDEAVNFGKVEMVETLTRHGGYLPGNMIEGRTLLHRAAEKGKTRMVEAMIRAGADANEKTSGGATPLLIAISLRQSETAEMLLQFPEVRRGINEHRNDGDPQKRTAFQLAIARGMAKIVGDMLDFGADVNAPDAEGVTPLRRAITQSDLPLIKTLIEHGADTAKIAGGKTLPLILAAGSLDIADGTKRAEIVKLLISKGADPDAVQPVTGMTPLMLAIMVSNGAEAAAELLKHYPKTETYDREGFTPIYYTMQKPTTELLKMVIAAGANVNARQLADARTPLIQAVHDGSVEAVKILLAAGANPRLYDSHNRSALSYARAKKDPEIAKLIESALTPRPKSSREFTL